MPNRNDPYSRPINATRPEGQMLQGEFYGDHATDKVLHRGTRGQAVHQVRPMVAVVPAWPDEQPEKPQRARNKKSASPNTDASSPSEPAISEAITEDDLFG